jgi:hypothetical protein
MIKYIVLAVIALSAYKYYIAHAGYDFSSNEYNFKVKFPGEPTVDRKKVKSLKGGDFVVMTYRIEHDELTCGVVISDYSTAKKKQQIGSIDDVIQPIEDGLIEEFDGELDHSGIIFKGDVKGYEIYVTANNQKKISSRVFQYSDSIYNLTCHFNNTESNNNDVNDFMESFRFLHQIKK